MNDETTMQVRALSGQGMSVEDIGDELCLSEPEVYHHLCKLNSMRMSRTVFTNGVHQAKPQQAPKLNYQPAPRYSWESKPDPTPTPRIVLQRAHVALKEGSFQPQPRFSWDQ